MKKPMLTDIKLHKLLRYENLNTLLQSHRGNRPGGNFCSFNLHGKGKIPEKNKTNTDPNLTANPNPKLTIDKAAKRKKLNKVP